jgi:hypothetical protein
MHDLNGPDRTVRSHRHGDGVAYLERDSHRAELDVVVGTAGRSACCAGAGSLSDRDMLNTAEQICLASGRLQQTAGDLATVATHFAANAVWELPGTSQVAGTYTGPEQIVGFLAKAYELSGGTLALDLVTILGDDWGAV